MPKYLIKSLIVPCLIAIIAALIIGYYFPWEGLFVNVASSFISVVITVIYVDRVIQEHDKKVWSKVSQRIQDRINAFVHIVFVKFRIAYGFDIDIFNWEALQLGKPDLRRAEVIRITEHVLLPATLSKLEKMDPSDWKNFAEELQSISQQADRIIDLYGNKLEPDILQTLLEVQDKIGSISNSYYTFPDVFGVPDDKLPKPKNNKISTVALRTFPGMIGAVENELPKSSEISIVEFKQLLTKQAARDSSEILTSVLYLLKNLPLHG